MPRRTFYQPQYIQCTHYGLYLCPPLCSSSFADNTRCQFAIALYGFPLVLLPAFSIATGFIAEKFLVLFSVYSAVQQVEHIIDTNKRQQSTEVF